MVRDTLMLNKGQSKEFEKKLLEKRQDIVAKKSSKLGPAADLNPEYGQDEADRANASQAKEMNWLLGSQEGALLELVDAALARVQDGTFGECLHCGQEISVKRLSAVPWTRYCITCQELIEQYGT
jgi:DnaK suppressor protein